MGNELQVAAQESEENPQGPSTRSVMSAFLTLAKELVDDGLVQPEDGEDGEEIPDMDEFKDTIMNNIDGLDEPLATGEDMSAEDRQTLQTMVTNALENMDIGALMQKAQEIVARPGIMESLTSLEGNFRVQAFETFRQKKVAAGMDNEEFHIRVQLFVTREHEATEQIKAYAASEQGMEAMKKDDEEFGQGMLDLMNELEGEKEDAGTGEEKGEDVEDVDGGGEAKIEDGEDEVAFVYPTRGTDLWRQVWDEPLPNDHNGPIEGISFELANELYTYIHSEL
jgi:hypothetical protein